jgi:hypothetical protein
MFAQVDAARFSKRLPEVARFFTRAGVVVAKSSIAIPSHFLHVWRQTLARGRGRTE